jgi:hypothetical protein
LDVPSIIEATGRPVLVVGSVPPAGRDWDLFVRPADREVLERRLRDQEFVQIARHWLRVADSTDVVEILDPADWQLTDGEVEALFETAVPLDADHRLRIPAPPQRLLILARKLPRTPGLLEPKHRELIRATLAESPAAFEDARRHAAAWGLTRRLYRLEARYGRRSSRSRPPRFMRRPRRGAVIALSGLDGVGKSSQAKLLASSLAALGYDTEVVWAPIGQNEALRGFARTIKGLLARLPIGPGGGEGGGGSEGHLLSRTEPGTPDFGLARRLFAHAWSTVTTLANLLVLRRAGRGTRLGGRIVIYDRYVLDTVVELRFRYAPNGRMPFQEALARGLARPARRAYLLDLPADIAHARKPDWSLEQTRVRSDLYRQAGEELGVAGLDAARPIEDLSREILSDVLLALRG